MSEATFGERLAEARRRKGETVEEVSEQLRIRPSIITALETGNFAHMPHKGYSRNMVSSYARYLGLNSTHITEQFLKEFHRYENSGMPLRSGSANKPDNYQELATTTTEGANGSTRRQITLRGQRETITAAKRNQARGSYWGSDDKVAGIEQDFQKHMHQAQIDKDVIAAQSSRRAPQSKSRQVRSNEYVGKPPNRSFLSGIFSNLSSRPVLLIVGLVIVFLAILIAWAILASSCSKNEVSNVPVTGVSNSSSGLAEDEVGTVLPDIEAQMAEDSRYGPFQLRIEVVDGATWLQINIDGGTPVAEVCEPPWENTYTVNTIASIESAAPGYVKVYRNGVETPLEVNDNGLGVVELKVEQRPIVQNAQNAQNAQNNTSTEG